MKEKEHRDIIYSVDVSTRGKRKKAMSLVIRLLEKICYGEERFQFNIPLNLQSGPAYEAAEISIDIMIDAISVLRDAYE